MMVPDSRVEKALTYLATTDIESAELKSNVARTEYVAKLREYSVFKTLSGGVEERKAVSKTDQTVISAWDAHFNAVAAYEKVRAKRELEALIVDVWRTTQANRRSGQI